MADDTFSVSSSTRLPGLGLLLLPGLPAPAWLTAPPLHAAVGVQLHRPGQPPLALAATIEEIGRAGQPPARALLLDADPAGEVGPDAWLTFLPPEFAFAGPGNYFALD